MKRGAAPQVYQDFDPPSDYVSDDNSDTLLVYLPGFKKEELRVQLTSTGNLIIRGEQPVENNILRRFKKEVPVSKNSEAGKITAKFEDYILYIVQPKLKTAAENKVEEKLTSTEATKAQKPEASGQKQTLTTNETSNKSAGKVEAQEKEKEQEDGDGKSKKLNGLKSVHEKASGIEKSNAKSDSKSSETDNKVNGTAEGGEMKENSAIQKHEGDVSNFATKVAAEAKGMKMPKKAINLVVAILLAVAFGLYLKRSVTYTHIAEN